MRKGYFELRPPDKLKTAVGSDIAKHFQSRQFLGSAVVICEHPFAMLSVTRKAWQRQVRQNQIERARTLNAEEVLRLTRRAIQMQRLRFTSSLPEETPCADVYFLTPESLTVLPSGCYTLYLTIPIDAGWLKRWVPALLHESLVVNYDVGAALSSLGLRPKIELESSLLQEWHGILVYLRGLDITPEMLDIGNQKDPDLNATLDILLGVGQGFIERASEFQHRLDIAQPITTIPDITAKRIETLLRLAHRVQALVPPNPHLQQIFGSTETFFLRDRSAELLRMPELRLSFSSD